MHRRHFLRTLLLLPFVNMARPRPQAQRTLLLTTHVAGYRYHGGPAIERSLTPTTPLELKREPSNHHDPNAIAILTRGGAKLGYVPRKRNDVLARMMDAEMMLYVRLVSIRAEPAPSWHRVEVEIGTGMEKGRVILRG